MVKWTHRLHVPILRIQQHHSGLCARQSRPLLPAVETHELCAQDTVVLHVRGHQPHEAETEVEGKIRR